MTVASITNYQSSDGETHWRYRIRLHGHPPAMKAGFRTRTEAERVVQQVEAALRRGEHLPSSESTRRTLSEAIDRYVDDVLPRKSISTQDS